MVSMQPQLPIEVDQHTGVWTTDGLPMLYVPRHFFHNLHLSIETAMGRDAYAAILYPSGHKSAWFWCEQEAKTHNLSGVDVFAHYLKRLSQRGWGQFSFVRQELEQGYAEIRAANSSFVLHQQRFNLSSATPGCYMFAGWWAGAADWVAHNQGWKHTYQSNESRCVGCGAPDCCVFTISSTNL